MHLEIIVENFIIKYMVDVYGELQSFSRTFLAHDV